jgi:large subunit ribosomal protein L13
VIRATTYSTKVSEIKRNWHIIDATNLSLGRLSSHAAILLRGKHKVHYTPNLDTGDFVIVINASKVQLTGNKWNDKMYNRFTGWLGGMKKLNAEHVKGHYPNFLVEHAVKGMLPKGPLGRDMLTKLKIYADEKHPHVAQKPQAYKVN